MVFSMGALLIVMIFTGTPFTWYFLLFPLVILQLYVFCCGIGFFLAQANIFSGYSIHLQGVYYSLDVRYPHLLFCGADERKVRFVIEYLNPAYYYVEQFRCFIYRGCLPEARLFIGGWVIAILAFVIGLLCFKKTQDKFILYI